MFGDLRSSSRFVGYLAGIPLFIHWSAIFLAISAYQRGDGGLEAGILALISLIAGIVLHELGHGLTARSSGATGLSITLWAMGGLCESRRDPSNLLREILIVAAGPAVSLVLWLGSKVLLSWLISHHPGLVFQGGGPSLLGSFLYIFRDVQFMLLMFNLLPIYPLDGGQLTFLGTLAVSRNLLLARQVSLSLAVLGALVWIAWATGLFAAFASGAPDPVGVWLHGMAQEPVFTLVIIVFMAFLLQSAFVRLY
jgi:Zn-dependent protease